MERLDQELAFLLRYENVAWYEKGQVRILDRRVYPHVRYEVCTTYDEVVAAIAGMVTQSLGPYMAAGMGVALAAYQARNLSGDAFAAFVKTAAQRLCTARPTTSVRMLAVGEACSNAAIAAREAGQDAAQATADMALHMQNEKYRRGDTIAKYLVERFPDKGTVMTQCFAESTIGFTFLHILKQKKDIKIICPETRPYFQGARLTASIAKDEGMDVTVITDNMPGHVMGARHVDVFTCAGDAICMDGYVVNKIGTFQIALCAQYYGIPVYITGCPDRKHESIQSVTLEERDPTDVLMAMGVRTAMKGVNGYYPAFDATPPKLVTGIVTDKGVYSPLELKRYFEV